MIHKWSQIAAIGTMAAGLMFAQAGPPDGGPRPRRGGNFDPAQMEQRRLDFLAQRLSLTDSQKQQAKTIFDAAQQANQALRDQIRQAHDALSTAAKAGRSDAEISVLGTNLGNLEGQVAANDAKGLAKFYALLTPDQKTKYDSAPRGPMGFGGRPAMQRQQ
jgi:protein CpxP